MFTTPSAIWDSLYRANNPQASFVLRDGRQVLVPSLVYQPAAQRLLIESSELQFLELSSFLRNQLPEIIPEALSCLRSEDPVVSCYNSS